MSLPSEGVPDDLNAWVKVGFMRDNDEVQWNDVKFFPFAHLVPAIEDMKGVSAICGGNKIKLIRVDPVEEVLHPLSEIIDRSHANSGGPTENFYSVSWSIDPVSLQPILAAAGVRGVIKIFNARTTIEEGMLYGHGGAIFALAFSPSHPHIIASASLDHTIRIWNTTFSLKREQTRPGSRSDSLLPDWDNPPGQLVTILAGVGGHQGPVCSVAWHPVHPLLATGGMDHQLKIWYLSELPGFPTDTLLQVSSLAQSLETVEKDGQANSQPAPITQLPIFSSKHLHAHWIDQIIWASSLSPILISKSPLIAKESNHPLAEYAPAQNIEPATEVNIWQPSILESIFIGSSVTNTTNPKFHPLVEDSDVGGLDFDRFLSFKVRRPTLNAEQESTQWGLGMCLSQTNVLGKDFADLTILIGNHPSGIAEVSLFSLENQGRSSTPMVNLHRSSTSNQSKSHYQINLSQENFRAIDLTEIVLSNRLLSFPSLLRAGQSGLIEFWKQKERLR